MATITELRQKRAALWEKTKKFLDDAKRENDMLSADDVTTYEKMEAEIEEEAEKYKALMGQ